MSMIIINSGQDHNPGGYSYAKMHSCIASDSFTNQDHHTYHDVLRVILLHSFSSFTNIQEHKIVPLNLEK